MQIYLVGGAVRDQLLGLPISDRDWVVTGATSDDLIKLGFQQVGKKFPVFIHPKTGEEYALARKEYKIGIGYTGFSCYTGDNISIKDDLLRRDITINAIAQTEDGQLVDYYNGKQDIKKRLLRHVSNAFIEDPLRIFRVARFAAQLSKQKFTIANETLLLMKEKFSSYDIKSISIERIWIETEKALKSFSPEIYFYVLYQCNVLSIIFPEINELFNISIYSELYPIMNAGIQMLSTLKIVASLTDKIEFRFAIICYNLSKIIIKSKQNNINKSIILIKTMCNRLRISKKIKEIVILTICFNKEIKKINKLTPEILINLFNKLDVWRKPERINQLSLISKIYSYILIGEEYSFCYQQIELIINKAFKIVQKISSKILFKQGINGIIIKNKLNKKRIYKLTIWWQNYILKNNLIK